METIVLSIIGVIVGCSIAIGLLVACMGAK
jgi:hypothetical protein